MNIEELRRIFHTRVCKDIVKLTRSGETVYPNFADKASTASRAIANGIITQLGCASDFNKLSGQTAGILFEGITRDFLAQAFALIQHLRPGEWYYSTQSPISEFDQYEHLAHLEAILKQDDDLASSLGRDYIITPDIVIGRKPITDTEINQYGEVISREEPIATLTPVRAENREPVRPILHASISCKWTLRSDRGQNARTEALNLIRNRKGHLPHIVAVTAEPLPTRIASLALGTGDLDCVYHFALPELQEAISQIDNEDQMDMLKMLIDGRRLRDISDLPFDLAA